MNIILFKIQIIRSYIVTIKMYIINYDFENI